MTVSSKMIERALDAYEAELRKFYNNNLAEPISVSEIRSRCISAALTAALSDQVVVPNSATGIVRRVGWMLNKDVDAGGDDNKFFGVVIEYLNEPPDFSPSIVWARTPVCIEIAAAPASISGEVKSG